MSTIFCHRPYIRRKPTTQADEGQNPKDDAQWERHAQLQFRRLVAEVEGHYDCAGDDGEIHG